MPPGPLFWLLESFKLIFDPNGDVLFVQKNFLHKTRPKSARNGEFLEKFFGFEVKIGQKRPILYVKWANFGGP